MMQKYIDKISAGLGVSSTGLVRYFRNTVWVFIERFLTMFIGMLVGIAVARYLGPNDYGILQYGFTLLTMAANFGAMGIDDLIIRDALKSPEREGDILGTAISIRGGACLLSFIGCSAFAFFTTDRGTFLPVFLIIAGVLFQPLGIVALYFQMKVRSELKAKAVMIGYSFAAVIKVVLIIVEAPLIYFAIAMIIDTITAMLFFLIFYLRENNFKLWRFDKETFLYFFKIGWPLALIMIFSTIYNKIDMLLVKNLLGNDDLGVYSAAVRLTEVWYYIPTALSMSLFPAIVNAKNNRELIGEYEARIEKILRLLSFGSICLGIFVGFTSKYIIDFLYKTDYVGASGPLAIFIWCLLFFSFNVISLKWLMVENEIMLGLYRGIAGVAVNLVLNYIFIKLYGIKGAAIGTLLSFAFFAYFIDLFSKKTRLLFMLKTRSIVFPIAFVYRLIKR